MPQKPHRTGKLLSERLIFGNMTIYGVQRYLRIPSGLFGPEREGVGDENGKSGIPKNPALVLPRTVP